MTSCRPAPPANAPLTTAAADNGARQGIAPLPTALSTLAARPNTVSNIDIVSYQYLPSSSDFFFVSFVLDFLLSTETFCLCHCTQRTTSGCASVHGTRSAWRVPGSPTPARWTRAPRRGGHRCRNYVAGAVRAFLTTCIPGVAAGDAEHVRGIGKLYAHVVDPIITKTMGQGIRGEACDVAVVSCVAVATLLWRCG